MKRGYINTEAIVLRTADYSESDTILTLLTRTKGKLAAIAKGAKRSRRRFVGSLDVISLVDAVLFRKESMELARLEAAKLIEPYGELKADMERLGYASYMAELVDCFIPPDEPNEHAFTHLKGFLSMLKTADAEPTTRFFEIRLLGLAGLMPQLTECVGCGRAVEDRMGFSVEKGGLMCRACLGGGALELSVGTVKTLLMAVRLPVEKLHVLATGEVFKKEARKMLSECIKYHLGRVPKSMKFIEMVELI